MSDEDLFEAVDTERTHLRCVRRDDAATVARLMTPAISRWLASWPTPVTEQWVETRILEAREEIVAGQALHFLVERRTDREVMGWIRVSRVQPNSRQGDLGYWLNEAYQGHGYTTEAAFMSVVPSHSSFWDWIRLKAALSPRMPHHLR
jgi:ribosomal-protein-alanine N-acetyltransferase